MALTNEILSANEVLNGLTDEQRQAIVTLSQNDENSVIGARIGEIYRQLDDTIFTSTGVKRDGDEKTYKYLERAAKELKSRTDGAAGLQKQIDDLTAERDRLKGIIDSGSGSEEVRRQLQQTRAELDETKNQYNELKKKMDKSEADHKKALFGMRVDSEIQAAASGLKLRKDINEELVRLAVESAVSKVKTYSPDYIDDGNGGQKLVFRTADGAVMNNPENRLNPYTCAELLHRELKDKGVLDETPKQGGGGTGASGGSGGNRNLAGAKTQREAMDLAREILISQGKAFGTDEYQEGLNQLWKDNNIEKLPL